MPQVAPIGLQYNPKTLWFDPKGLEIHKGDSVVVETARGIEFGHAADNLMDVSDKDIKALKSGLKPVIRLATPEDEEKAASMIEKSKEALPVFKEMAAESSKNMHPVSVEYLLEGDKAIFYFEAEERIDFRELVRKLASHFRIRVDMRQIGVRDEARMIGGYGHCGQELCCKRMGGEFCPVSIRMAKEQDLSLNPQKISGVCGRLMCCLRYEFDTYKEFKHRAPKVNAQIQTPDGKAKVINLDVPREMVTLRLEEGKTVTIPLGEMTKEKGADRPTKVEAEVLERYLSPGLLNEGESSSLSFDTTKLTGEDKLADPSARSAKGSRKKAQKGESPSRSEKPNQKRKPRKRRTHVGADGQEKEASSKKNQTAGKKDVKNTAKKNSSGQRPGQKSSGLRKSPQTAKKNNNRSAAQKSAPSKASESATPQRKSRRRSHKAGSSNQE